MYIKERIIKYAHYMGLGLLGAGICLFLALSDTVRLKAAATSELTIVNAVPQDSWDIGMDAVITELGEWGPEQAS